MRNQLARIGMAALAVLTLAACVDDQDPFAPPTPDSVIAAAAPGGFGILNPIFPNPEDFMDITAGDYHTCARKYNGKVYCWGQLGGPLHITKAIDEPKLAATDTRTVVTGANHTCTLNLSGAAFCWGAGSAGQLGIAEGQYSTTNNVPVAPPSFPSGSTAALSFTTLAAGGNSTCGSAPSGTYCWGYLGIVATGGWPGAGAPRQIGTFSAFTSLAVGSGHACGTISTMESFCFGANNFGQSGVDPAVAINYPGTSNLVFAQANGLGASVSRISTHENFTCADKTNGTVQCFGSNANGALGNGQTGTGVVFLPQTVGSALPAGDQPSGLHLVSAGAEHACALDQNNAAWCWGWNGYGQLGRGLSANRSGAFPVSSSNPVRVLGGLAYKAMAAGRNHTCAIGTDNHIYCWGQNNYRQLGTYIFANGQVVTNGYAPEPVLTM